MTMAFKQMFQIWIQSSFSKLTLDYEVCGNGSYTLVIL